MKRALIAYMMLGGLLYGNQERQNTIVTDWVQSHPQASFESIATFMISTTQDLATFKACCEHMFPKLLQKDFGYYKTLFYQVSLHVAKDSNLSALQYLATTWNPASQTSYTTYKDTLSAVCARKTYCDESGLKKTFYEWCDAVFCLSCQNGDSEMMAYLHDNFSTSISLDALTYAANIADNTDTLEVLERFNREDSGYYFV